MAELNGAKLEKLPLKFQLGDHIIDGAVIRPMTFQSFSSIVVEAYALKEPEAWLARMRRLRLSRQVSYYSNGTAVQVGFNDVPKMGIGDARSLIAKLDDNEGPPGKIVRDGDGVEKAVVYQLGTPIKMQKGDPISEIEFHATTYGDVEDVLAAENSILQAITLIKKLGKPLHSSLMALPSWAIDAITVSDGVFIMNEILPRFQGSPDE